MTLLDSYVIYNRGIMLFNSNLAIALSLSSVFVQFATHPGAVFLFSGSFDSVPKCIDIIEAKPPYDSTPRINVRKRVVKVRSNAAQLGEFCPGNVWEVMVFIVVTNVPSELVEDAIVQVSFCWE